MANNGQANYSFLDYIIHHLPQVNAESVAEEMCPICLEPLAVTGVHDTIVETEQCHHTFHRSCLLHWADEDLRVNSDLEQDAGTINCPCCRTKLCNMDEDLSNGVRRPRQEILVQAWPDNIKFSPNSLVRLDRLMALTNSEPTAPPISCGDSWKDENELNKLRWLICLAMRDIENALIWTNERDRFLPVLPRIFDWVIPRWYAIRAMDPTRFTAQAIQCRIISILILICSDRAFLDQFPHMQILPHEFVQLFTYARSLYEGTRESWATHDRELAESMLSIYIHVSTLFHEVYAGTESKDITATLRAHDGRVFHSTDGSMDASTPGWIGTDFIGYGEDNGIKVVLGHLAAGGFYIVLTSRFVGGLASIEVTQIEKSGTVVFTDEEGYSTSVVVEEQVSQHH